MGTGCWILILDTQWDVVVVLKGGRFCCPEKVASGRPAETSLACLPPQNDHQKMGFLAIRRG